MRSHLRNALAFLLLALPLGAAAQDLPIRVGFGGSLDVGGVTFLDRGGFQADVLDPFVPIGFTDLSVPIYVGNLRLEPHFGWLHLKDDYSIRADDEEMDFDNANFDAVRVGLGVAWAWDVAERTKLYAGPRFGLIFRSDEREFLRPESMIEEEATVTRTLTSTDFWIGVGVGGEAFLTENFSLGLEAQLTYTDLGVTSVDVKTDPAPEPEPDPEPNPDLPEIEEDIDQGFWSTRVLVSLRFYFL